MALPAFETRYEHIVLDENQVPIIEGTTMKEVELVLEKTAYGWNPEELHLQHPYLTLGRICSALAYYWDHQNKLDRNIERRLRERDRIRQETSPPALVIHLKTQGLI